MIWQNPWALAGILAIAVPLLIHLLTRPNARVQNFPSLRFIPAEQLIQSARSHLTDPLLLLVRCAVLMAVVAAVAQPLFMTAARSDLLNRTNTAVVVVDTSASMHNGTVAPVAAARQMASRFAADNAATILETDAPADALDAAAALLQGRSGKRTIVVVSDFQRGTLSQNDVARVPTGIGISLQRVPGSDTTLPRPRTATVASLDVRTTVTSADSGTAVDWEFFATAADAGATLTLLSHASEREVADAALRATARVIARPSADTAARSVVMANNLVLVLPRYPGRNDLAQDAADIRTPWMGNVIVSLKRDSLLALAAVASSGSSGAGVANAARGPVGMFHTGTGELLLSAGSATLNGRATLVLFLHEGASEMFMLSLVAAASRAVAAFAPSAEFDPVFTSDATLRSWERPAGAANTLAPESGTGAADSRWFWIGAALLLIVETLLRRSRKNSVRREATVESTRLVA